MWRADGTHHEYASAWVERFGFPADPSEPAIAADPAA
jgi:hypothetical protein